MQNFLSLWLNAGAQITHGDKFKGRAKSSQESTKLVMEETRHVHKMLKMGRGKIKSYKGSAQITTHTFLHMVQSLSNDLEKNLIMLGAWWLFCLEGAREQLSALWSIKWKGIHFDARGSCCLQYSPQMRLYQDSLSKS